MSAKVNIKDIVVGHINTLIEAGTSKVSYSDILSFYVYPILMAVIGMCFCFNVSEDVVSLLVNFGAIFTALLLSVLVLVYDQENKIDQDLNQGLREAKKKLLEHLYYNICYCIVISIALVVVCLLHSIINDISLMVNIYLVTPIIIIVATNLVLTILMIVKRMHVLLVS